MGGEKDADTETEDARRSMRPPVQEISRLPDVAEAVRRSADDDGDVL